MSAAGIDAMLEQFAGHGIRPVGLTADSRSVQAGDVFAAYPGARSDGRRHAADAVMRGACAVLWEAGEAPPALGVPVLEIEGVRALSGFLAHRLYGEPSARLWLAGVTGTNGKTTVSQWIARALDALGQPCAVVGTLGCGFPGRLAEGVNTTPDAPSLHRLLAEFLEEGAVAAAMEVSSIGLDQGRVNGALFDVAIFTNLSRDHLDYHPDMDAYAEAKARLFDMPGLTAAILNLDDVLGIALARRLVARGGLRVIGYTLEAANLTAVPGAEVLHADQLVATPAGMRFELAWGALRHAVGVPLVARFNISNLLAVIAALHARGIALEEVLSVVSQLSAPEGRMQMVGGVGEPLVVIDYAHTPDALGKVLEALRPTAEARGGRLVCVFGCGGERDAGKRPLRAEMASRLADLVVVTSDNPRGEDPEKIIDAVMAGLQQPGQRIAERGVAIAQSVAAAAADDVILIAGKGHEPYQEVMGTRHPVSDVHEARAALRHWNHACGSVLQ
jgi:UDP-N-acetylmuramoyl-L-alanyl-D-glutamate--2,6-diaminopimelate ligase